MKVEIPELKRCCCCIPLRYGLIGWGYIKLVIVLFLCVADITSVVINVQRVSKYPMSRLFVTQTVVTTMILLILLVDISLTIVFLVGGHRKSVKLLRVSYIYSIVEFGLFAVFFLLNMAATLYHVSRYPDHYAHGLASSVRIMQVRLLLGLAFFGVLLYIILLMRSEINKLKNSGHYRFTNPTQSAQEVETTNGAEPATAVNGPDNQFEGIITQNKGDSESYKYIKF